MNHNYAAHLYTRDLFLGTIYGKTLSGMKKIASRKCNNYNSSIDKMTFIKIDGEESNITFYRFNQRSPDNTIIRGKWR